MIRKTVPGEVMDVDYGYLGKVLDEQGAVRKVEVFSGRLRHSRKAYREVAYSQKQERFFQSHVFAFEYFGGVPSKVVLDNLKAGVIQSTVDNEMLNRIYVDLAEHCNLPLFRCAHQG